MDAERLDLARVQNDRFWVSHQQILFALDICSDLNFLSHVAEVLFPSPDLCSHLLKQRSLLT